MCFNPDWVYLFTLRGDYNYHPDCQYECKVINNDLVAVVYGSAVYSIWLMVCLALLEGSGCVVCESLLMKLYGLLCRYIDDITQGNGVESRVRQFWFVAWFGLWGGEFSSPLPLLPRGFVIWWIYNLHFRVSEKPQVFFGKRFRVCTKYSKWIPRIPSISIYKRLSSDRAEVKPKLKLRWILLKKLHGWACAAGSSLRCIKNFRMKWKKFFLLLLFTTGRNAVEIFNIFQLLIIKCRELFIHFT